MKRGFRSTINILDFIRTGKFGEIELGFDYHHILKKIPKPDDVDRMSKGVYIWTYGSFEFHFFDGNLFTFWCDQLDFMFSPRKKQFKLDRWIIGKYKDGFKLSTFIKELQKENITFEKLGTFFSDESKDSLPDNVILKIDNATSVIYFENTDEDATDYFDYKLIAIGAACSEYKYRTRLL